jgi:hypothetical protein
MQAMKELKRKKKRLGLENPITVYLRREFPFFLLGMDISFHCNLLSPEVTLQCIPQ